MAKIPISFTQEGFSDVQNNLNTIKKETKAITQSKVKININNKDIQAAINAQGQLEKSLSDLQKSYTQLGNKSTSAARQMKKDINSITNALKNFEVAVQYSGKVSSTIQNTVKAQSYTKAINAQILAENKKTAALKEQQRELDKLDKKAQEVGQMTKSILQDKGLNQKGAKDTAAQWEYQKRAIQDTATEIKNAKNASKEYSHMLESMAYEVKHVTGKSLFQDAIDGTNKLINLENKRFEAQKSGKQIMEDYYNSEIQKQKELVKNLTETATNPQKLQDLLKENAEYIKNMLPEDIQKDFEQQMNQTGMIDNAWAQGMQKYVEKLQDAYNKQVKLNQAKSQQNLQDDSYKSLKADLQEVWNLENRLTELQKDPSKHTNEIQYTQELLNEKKSQLNLEQRINELSPKQAKSIKNAAKAQEEFNGKIKSQVQDWKNNNQKVSELGETIKKVFNYVLVYRGFKMLQEGIQKALDTMKELDKAFTDIQMVTGDSKEETAQLAQDYNQLAKDMGSTTKEVAEGAAEWFNESRDHLKTLELLETRED